MPGVKGQKERKGGHNVNKNKLCDKQETGNNKNQKTGKQYIK